MRTLGRLLGRTIILLLVLGAAMWTWGPYEVVSVKPRFDTRSIGPDVVSFFIEREARYDNIIPGVEKRVVWREAQGARTELAIVYIHGFSATSEELRPVPDRVAEAVGANLIFTRLKGHGRDGEALATATVQDWADDLAEALAVARVIADEVVIMATSTGATLTAAMLDQPETMKDVKGVILVSPNFAINNPLASLLTLPAARNWVPLIGGKERNWEPQNEAHGKYWTTRYPSEAVFQMAALVELAAAKSYADIKMPTLFWFSDADQVVSATATRDVISRWGHGAIVKSQASGEGLDPNAHVIAGDILSPEGTSLAVSDFTNFIKLLK
ncbi:alpha/beta hydrolase [Shimia sp. W99]